MTTNSIQSAYRRVWWGLTLRGLLGIALGALIIWRPMESIAAFALVIALWALMIGMVQVVDAFDLRLFLNHWWLLLLNGLVSIEIGRASCRERVSECV